MQPLVPPVGAFSASFSRAASPLKCLCVELVVAFALFLCDVAALLGSFVAAVGLSRIAAFADAPPQLHFWLQDPVSSHLLLYLVSMTFVLLSFCGQRLYSRSLPFWEEFAQYLKRIGYGAAFELVLLALLSEARIDYRALVLTWLYVATTGPLLRASMRKVMSLTSWWHRPAIIVGTGENALATYEAFRQDDSLAYRVTAFICEPGDLTPSDKVLGLGHPVFTMREGAQHLAQNGRGALIVLALDTLDGKEALFRKLVAMRSRVLVAPPLRGFPVHGMEVLPLFVSTAV